MGVIFTEVRVNAHNVFHTLPKRKPDFSASGLDLCLEVVKLQNKIFIKPICTDWSSIRTCWIFFGGCWLNTNIFNVNINFT